MKALRRSHTSTTSPSDSNSPTSTSSSWIHLRSFIIVVASSPAADRASLKSPWSRRKRKRALSKHQWKSFFTPEGKLRDGGLKFLKKVRSGGIDPSIRAEVWPFLLGVYDLSSTEAERLAIKAERRKEYEKLRRQCQRLLNHSDEVDREMNVIDEVISAEIPILKEGSDPPDCEDAFSATPSFSNEQESLDYDNRNQRGVADEGDKETKGMDEIISAESRILKEGSESPDSDNAFSITPSPSNKQESLDDNNRDLCGFSHDDASALQLDNLEEDKSETIRADASAEEVSGITHVIQLDYDNRNQRGVADEGDKEMKGMDEIISAESPILKEGSESPVSDNAFSITPSPSNKQESLDNNNNRDLCGFSHEIASALQLDNVEEDKSETIRADASAEEEVSGITHVDTSSVGSESSVNESSDEETERMLTSSNIEEIMETDPEHAKDAPKSERTTEGFATWQRIIRLDAIRANAEWVIYSPIQAAVSEEKALELAASVGLKDCDHLEPCRVYHASRLVAILEAYALYDQEIGYCQGMSDLLSPILAVMEEDDEAFWCFVGFMKKARHNFRLDEVGIQRQLNIVSKIIKFKDSHLYRHLEKLQAEDCFFVYRMVVVLFRRELDFNQTLCLWEVMWADQAAIRAGIGKLAWGRIRSRAPPTDDLLLYAIAACVLQRRKLIIESYSSMDDIIRECNNMEGRLDVWKLLDDAHDLVVTLHEKI